jgi:DNA-binding transcriptional regulator YhcF (GntR family)
MVTRKSRSAAIEPVKRVSLSEQVARGLLQFIETAPVLPGETLPSEQTLAARFGVSRPIVREALKSLMATGVVQVVNGKGAVVHPSTWHFIYKSRWPLTTQCYIIWYIPFAAVCSSRCDRDLGSERGNSWFQLKSSTRTCLL